MSSNKPLLATAYSRARTATFDNMKMKTKRNIVFFMLIAIASYMLYVLDKQMLFAYMPRMRSSDLKEFCVNGMQTMVPDTYRRYNMAFLHPIDAAMS